ncbi:MAG TPA: hypothetical protein VG013_14130 [Gemmataceae bacterium]|jgi:tetratricopeptide (TPR) repeat protein|nr:hypothetical protein [Gemmataceae bacterium]
MTNKARHNRREPVPGADGIEALYVELLHLFYEEGNREQAQKVASRLEDTLAARTDFAGSIRAEEIRSLLAELRGDLAEAIHSREAEIRKILELHVLAVKTPSWQHVVRLYDFSDVSDRLDLLAILYDEQGNLDRARATLQESKEFCESHHIPFDGQDLLDEFEQGPRGVDKHVGGRNSPRARIDDAVRAAYRQFRTSADEIVVNDAKARTFAEDVNRRLSGDFQLSMQEVRRRLLALRRRGEAHGGLPRLRR